MACWNCGTENRAGARYCGLRVGDWDGVAAMLDEWLELALWDGSAETASRVYEELDRAAFWGPALGADKARIKAGIAALEGRSQEALDGFRSALAAFHALELDFDEAATAVDAAVLLPPAERDEPDIKVAIEGAGATLRRLGGTPFVAQLERGLAAAPQPGPRSLTGSRSS